MTKHSFRLIFFFISLVSLFANGQQNEAVKTNVADKYYRQALYFYFQGDSSNALTEVERTHSRLGELDNRNELLRAGLQVSLGLHKQAQQSLMAFNHKYLETNDGQAKQIAPELLLVAQLSLAEQLIEQGKAFEAKKILASITVVNSQYYPQYTMLNQLAYWPENGHLTATQFESEVNNESEDVSYTPYIQLNSALIAIEQQDYQQAINSLNTLKVSTWLSREQTFWQTLFSAELFSFGETDSLEKEKADVTNQSQAINDYARLLLAQIYVQQEKFEAAYFELQTFPQHSPYTESALYLFAYAAQESKHFTSAFNIFSLLYQQYPYSQLGWQAGELLAEHISQQQSLAHGLHAYQNLEIFYQQRLTELDQFEQSDFHSQEAQNSVWLQHALQSASLSHLYQEFAQVTALNNQLQFLEQKSHWLAETITLNQQRKASILTPQKQGEQQILINDLTAKRDKLANKLSNAVSVNTNENAEQINHINFLGVEFANDNEQKWLNRIEQSDNSLNYIKEKSEKSNTKQQGNIIDYQQRLNRVKGALKWQLHQAFPQRAWQHKQQLKVIDSLLIDTQKQHSKISTMNESQQSLTAIIDRQTLGAMQVKSLLIKAEQLQEAISVKINSTIAHYISQQRQVLAQHQLSTKRAMANILETMAINDSKLEQQLSVPSLSHESEGR